MGPPPVDIKKIRYILGRNIADPATGSIPSPARKDPAEKITKKVQSADFRKGAEQQICR